VDRSRHARQASAHDASKTGEFTMRAAHGLVGSILAAALLVIAASAARAEGPSFDCAKAGTAAETLVCGDAELAALDRRVAAVYRDALEATEGMADRAEAKAGLKAEQRGWIKGRDECWKAEDLRACVEDAYLRREGELVATWMLMAPDAIVFWTCQNNPANELVTYFYPTALPSIRIEYGDSIDAGVLTRTASGSKYAASHGRSVWIKGESAFFEWPEGTVSDCVLRKKVSG
jgi:uncharacterized protein